MSAQDIYVDVDGTLVRSDLLVEGVFALIKQRPIASLWLPFWALRGKSFLKARIADLVTPPVHSLPYCEELVTHLREQSAAGRRIHLASASDRRYVQAIADHLGFVSGVLGSSSTENLKGRTKADAIVAQRGGEPFAYAGNDRADIPVWRRAAEGLVVNANQSVERAASQVTTVTRVISVPRPRLKTYLRAMRVHQWLKNVLIFIAPLISGSLLKPQVLPHSVAVFLAFCAIASGTYLLNDLFDLGADREHPTKRLRPLASGALPPARGALLSIVLIGGGLLLAFLQSYAAGALALVYLAVTLGYSLYLKEIVLIDSLTLAFLYAIRVVVGAAAIAVRPSIWLLAFSMFLFFSLALVKRCTELQRMIDQKRLGARGRDYLVSDAPYITQMGIASGYAAVLVVALYIDSATAEAQYRSVDLLWLICPLMLYWVSRLWIKTGRREMVDDPIVYAVRDRTSWLVFGALAIVWVLARFSTLTLNLWQ